MMVVNNTSDDYAERLKMRDLQTRQVEDDKRDKMVSDLYDLRSRAGVYYDMTEPVERLNALITLMLDWIEK